MSINIHELTQALQKLNKNHPTVAMAVVAGPSMRTGFYDGSTVEIWSQTYRVPEEIPYDQIRIAPDGEAFAQQLINRARARRP